MRPTIRGAARGAAREHSMTDQERQALMTLAIMAAFADDRNDAAERDEVKRVADSLSRDSGINVAALYRRMSCSSGRRSTRPSRPRFARNPPSGVRAGGRRVQRRRRPERRRAHVPLRPRDPPRVRPRGRRFRAGVHCAIGSAGGGPRGRRASAAAGSSGRRDRRGGAGSDDPQLRHPQRRARAAARVARVDGHHPAADEDGLSNRQVARLRARPRPRQGFPRDGRRWA
ncbi:MAG: hypothetical protein MZV70_42815 [Desulfobacterales bacterium]|nr:hypothetical protein [Desulfobacterales bacterium]